MNRVVLPAGLARHPIGLILLATVPFVGATNVYKCVDADGSSYFSDKQCHGSQEQTAIDLKPNPAVSGEEMAKLKKRQERQQRLLDAGAQDRRDQRRERAEEQAHRQAEKEAMCTAEKERLGKLESRHCTREAGCTIYGLTKIDEAGNSVFASEQEKRTEINRLKESIARNCE